MKKIEFCLSSGRTKNYNLVYFHQHGLEYIRLRLRCVKLFEEGKDFPRIAQTFGIHIKSCRKYLNIYLLGGFELLCQPSSRSQPSALNAVQQAAFKKNLTYDRSILISVPIIYCNPMKLLPFIFQHTFTVPKIRKP